MISVLPFYDRETVDFYFKKSGLVSLDTSGVVIAKEGDNVKGYCLYNLDSEKIILLAVEPKDDLMLCDGIIRSALHNALCAKVIKAFYCETSPEEIFDKLGFIISKEEKTLDISKLFKSCHGCAQQNT